MVDLLTLESFSKIFYLFFVFYEFGVVDYAAIFEVRSARECALRRAHADLLSSGSS